jgi:hypothetical protein
MGAPTCFCPDAVHAGIALQVLTGFGNKVALNADGSVMASQAEWNDPLTNTSKSE